MSGGTSKFFQTEYSFWVLYKAGLHQPFTSRLMLVKNFRSHIFRKGKQFLWSFCVCW